MLLEILQKAKERYFKEKPAEYYSQNKGAIKKSQGSGTKTYHKKKKTRLKSIKKTISATDSTQIVTK